MAFKFFSIPIRSADAAAEEMNGFLRPTRSSRSTAAGSSRGPTRCGSSASITSTRQQPAEAKKTALARRAKVDYKEVLSPEEFAVFARLRDVRKEIAQVEAVPVYTIFTNEQLAQMVQTRATTKAALEKIAGVGDARIEKYGPRILEFLQTHGPGPRMKRTGNLFQHIADRDNLRLAFGKAMRGKRSQARRVVFAADLEANLADAPSQLLAALPARRVPPIRDPSIRRSGVITAPVLCRAGAASRHHECLRAGLRSLADRRHICLPPGKGREAALRPGAAVRRAVPLLPQARHPQVFRQRAAREPAERLERLFKDRRLLELFGRIVRGFRPEIGRGLPIGSLTSQHFANFYLGWFDRFVKETSAHPRIRALHGRHGSVGRTSKRLAAVLIASRRFLRDELGFELKPTSPTQPQVARRGLPRLPRFSDTPGAQPPQPRPLSPRKLPAWNDRDRRG